MNAPFNPETDFLPLGQRVIAGILAGALVLLSTQIAVAFIPGDGSAFLRAWLDTGGVIAAGGAVVWALLDWSVAGTR